MIPDGSWPLHLFWSCGLFQALHSFKGAITLWLAIASLALKLLALCCLSLAHLPTFTVWLEFVAQKCLKHPFGSPEVNGNDGTNGWDGPSKQLDQGLEMFRSQGSSKAAGFQQTSRSLQHGVWMISTSAQKSCPSDPNGQVLVEFCSPWL